MHRVVSSLILEIFGKKVLYDTFLSRISDRAQWLLVQRCLELTEEEFWAKLNRICLCDSLVNWLRVSCQILTGALGDLTWKLARYFNQYRTSFGSNTASIGYWKTKVLWCELYIKYTDITKLFPNCKYASQAHNLLNLVTQSIEKHEGNELYYN